MMKKYLLLTLLLFSIKAGTLQAAVVPTTPSGPATTLTSLPAKFATLSIKEIQQLVGRKLTLKEKLGVKVLQWKMKKQLKRAKPAEGSSAGRTAYIFAMIALGSLVAMLFIPSLFFLTGLMALLALIFGNKGKQEDPNDRKAKTAFTIGWILLAVLIALIIAVLIAFANSSWSFG